MEMNLYSIYGAGEHMVIATSLEEAIKAYKAAGFTVIVKTELLKRGVIIGQ